MSKILYACSYRHRFSETTENKLIKICNALLPDNTTTYPEHKICVKDHTAYAATMNSNALHEFGLSVLLGVLFEKPEIDWITPKQNYPDGNYALFRNSTDEIEVVSDVVGSRTIWYYHDDELFVASTSQRAIILFLGTFSFDERVIPWMLSTGSLGPLYSWDKRLRRLQADSSALLDKKTWNLYVKQNCIDFTEVKRGREEHKELLTNAIRQTINHLKSVDFKNWVLPLSGGYDSRAILCFSKEQLGPAKDLRTVTWGLEESLNKEGNDAKVAKELACSLGVPHDYYQTNISSEPIEKIINRFIYCSEGRIDHLAGYMDGMEIWRKFHDGNIAGTIRGDVGFGGKQVSSELTVRQLVGCALCEDIENLKNVIDDFGLRPQQLPQEFKKRENESLSTWRDRLYHSYRLPTILASLSDIKFSYVEQITPLLSKTILSVVRTFPDNLRTDKKLFKEIVEKNGPDVPFANKGANANSKNILRKKSLVELLKVEIKSIYASELFGQNFVNYICDGIKGDEPISKTQKKQLKKIIESLPPCFLKNWLRGKALRPRIDGNVLAFRVFIIIRMHKALNADAVTLKS